MFSSKLQTNISKMLHQSKKWGPLWTTHGIGWNARSAESWCPRNGTFQKTQGRLGGAWAKGAQTLEENNSKTTLPKACQVTQSNPPACHPKDLQRKLLCFESGGLTMLATTKCILRSRIKPELNKLGHVFSLRILY